MTFEEANLKYLESMEGRGDSTTEEVALNFFEITPLTVCFECKHREPCHVSKNILVKSCYFFE